MDHFEQDHDAKRRLESRIELLREVVPKIHRIAQEQGKDGLVKYLTERFGAEPEDLGTDLLCNGWQFRFNVHGAFLGISSDEISTSAAIPRSDTGYDRSNDT